MKLIQRLIDTLNPPPGKAEAIHFDDALPGFGLRVRAGGSRVYIVQYKIGAKQRRVTLGTTAQLRLDVARDRARDILSGARLGHDAAGERAEARIRAADTCEAAFRRYLNRQKAQLRPKSYAETERYLLDHWKPLHGLAVARIERRTVAGRLTDLVETNGPAAADRARAHLSAFFAWAIREGLADPNPVVGTNRPCGPRSRDRVLTESELVEVWHAAGDDKAAIGSSGQAYEAIIRLLILTGQRRNEIGGLRWPEINFGGRLIRLPAERTKNGRAHDLPLSDPAWQLLRAMPHRIGPHDTVFSTAKAGFSDHSRAKHALDARLGQMAPWVLHDLRRSVATHMAEIGIAPHIIEAVLNHTSGHKAGVAGVYNKAAYEREKRAALALWADHVMALVEDRATSVVPLRAS
jgi:integrase